MIVISLGSIEPGNSLPIAGRPVATTNPESYGVLTVSIFTNENPGVQISNQSTTFFPVPQKPVYIYRADNRSEEPQVAVTNSFGFAYSRLAPSSYVVEVGIRTLYISLPVNVSDGEATRLRIRVYATTYAGQFGEMFDTYSSGWVEGGGNVFVKVGSSTPIANMSDTVVIRLRGASGAMYQANATVVGEEQRSGSLWLQLQPLEKLKTTDVSGTYVVVYTYSQNVAMFRLRSNTSS